MLAAGLAACGSGGGDKSSPKTLTYWASNQGTSLENDKQVLEPELKKFEQQTGIKVKLEVVPWSDLLNRILAAATSGQGPDVLNIGNTWSASLQATGALLPFDDATFAKIGGKDRFVARRARRRPARRARTRPPCRCTRWRTGSTTTRRCSPTRASPARRATWDELVADGKKLDQGRQVGPRRRGRATARRTSTTPSSSAKQHGADFFDASGKPTFDTPRERRRPSSSTSTSWPRTRSSTPSNAEYAAEPVAHRLRQRQGRDADVAGRRHLASRRTA